MREAVPILFCGANTEAEAARKILQFVFPLVRYMWWVVNHNIESRGTKWHSCVVANHARAAPRLHIHADYSPAAVPPEPPAAHCCVEYLFRLIPGIKTKHLIEQRRVITLPNRRKRTVCVNLS